MGNHAELKRKLMEEGRMPVRLAAALIAFIKMCGGDKKLIEENLRKRLPYTPTNKQIRWCCRNFIWFRYKYLGSMDDYFKAQIYRKSDFVREESLARFIRFPWRDALQRKEDWVVFQDKREFYHAFSDYLGRKWMVVDKNTSYEKYMAFVKSCSYEVFAKEPLGFGGKQVHLWKVESEKNLEKLFAGCMETPMILEEKINQCEELKSFSGTCVNTLRMITLIDKYGTAHVARAVFRIGSGKNDIDNFSSGGMAAAVDIDTGIICTMAVDRDGKEYIAHPVTGKQIIGYKIPDWEEYKEFARKLANYFPEMRYIGWDIVKDAEGNFCVVEGNKDAGADVMECNQLYGLLPLYNKILDGVC